MVKLIPSIASANPLFLATEINRLNLAGKYHVDIEDGNFIPNITFGIKTVNAIASYTKADLDVHLMVKNPEDYIEDLILCGIKSIAFHIETVKYPALLLNKIKKLGGRAGLAMNLRVSVSELSAYKELIDYVLIMTSEPDYQQQIFNPNALQRINTARRMLGKPIMVDGGIGANELDQVTRAGVEFVVMGRALWDAADPAKQYRFLMDQANKST